MTRRALARCGEWWEHDEKPANWLATRWTKSFSSRRKARENYSKLTERCANVYENKGRESIAREGSWNVYENKGTYPPRAGILLKIKAVNTRIVEGLGG